LLKSASGVHPLNTIEPMASDPKISYDDTEFQSRLDDLLSSALEDQAKEQRVLLETVHGARTTLAKAEEQLASLRGLVESRDSAVVDLLEARLSGLGTESSIEHLQDLVQQLVSRTPVEDLAGVMTAGMTEVATRLDDLQDGLKPLDPWKPAVEIQRSINERMQERLAPLEAAIAELSRSVGSLPEPLAQLVEDVSRTTGDQATSAMLGVVGRVEGLSTSLTSAVQQLGSLFGRIDSLEEAMSGDVDFAQDAIGVQVEDVARSIVTAKDEVVAGLEQARWEQAMSSQTVREELTAHSESMLRQHSTSVEALREEMTSAIETVIGEQAQSAEGLKAGIESVARGISDDQASMLQALRLDLAAGTERSISENYAVTTGGLREVKTAVTELLATASARLFDRMQQVRDDVEQVKGWVDSQQSHISSTISDAVEPFADELQTISERVRQSNRRITESNSRMEAMQESLVAYLAERDYKMERARDQILMELMAEMSESLKPKDKQRLGDAMRDAAQRKRDRRDAERWRRMRSGDLPMGPEAIQRVKQEMSEAPPPEPIQRDASTEVSETPALISEELLPETSEQYQPELAPPPVVSAAKPVKPEAKQVKPEAKPVKKGTARSPRAKVRPKIMLVPDEPQAPKRPASKTAKTAKGASAHKTSGAKRAPMNGSSSSKRGTSKAAGRSVKKSAV